MDMVSARITSFWAAMKEFFLLAEEGRYSRDFIMDQICIAAANKPDKLVPWMARVLPQYNDYLEEWEQVYGYITYTGSGHEWSHVLRQMRFAADGIRGSGLDSRARAMLPLRPPID